MLFAGLIQYFVGRSIESLGPLLKQKQKIMGLRQVICDLNDPRYRWNPSELMADSDRDHDFEC